MESEKFLRSLEHTNALRPKFSIKHEGYPMLEISQDEKSMQVPMAEILSFAQRWRADYEAQREARSDSTKLAVYPYPLYSTNMNDPDVVDVGWD